jgi:hypothetical protein
VSTRGLWPLRWGLGFALLSSCLLLVALVGTGRSATATSLKQVPIAEDAFLNYDFLSEDHSRYNVDWPISLLFWNNAHVDSIKETLDLFFLHRGSGMHAYVNNGAGWKWDIDSGRKTNICPVGGSAIHYRIYAPPSDAFYNLQWGFYVIGSVHFDSHECNPLQAVPGPVGDILVPWFGKSEVAEKQVAKMFEWLVGPHAASEDALWFRNFEQARKQGDHRWLNDGYATKLRMPTYERPGGIS